MCMLYVPSLTNGIYLALGGKKKLEEIQSYRYNCKLGSPPTQDASHH